MRIVVGRENTRAASSVIGNAGRAAREPLAWRGASRRALREIGIVRIQRGDAVFSLIPIRQAGIASLPYGLAHLVEVGNSAAPNELVFLTT
jgi:hypothetical protein